MQFTRLRLTGFKSFVDPTELAIAPGLTGVVGPNGCGKSNLLEAIRWVMGESRASAVRGEGMEDVIFLGSGSRPARSHAEVMLTLDNRERRAPAGFNEADTLEIVRRITKDAGSAYRANGREARARDIAMLFADAATGAQSPSLVRQGQISELINARPKARRRVLEEAAGISGLYQRRHEAELKLRATEANLGRVGDVLDGLNAHIAVLTRQAKQAARYREIAESLRRAEALLLYRLWRDAADEHASAAEALGAALRAAGAAQAAAAEASRLREAAEAAVPAAREEDTVAAAILQRSAVERDRLDADAAEAARRIAALEAAALQLAADRDRESVLDRDAAAMEARLETERVALIAAAAGHGAALAAARGEAERAGAALRMAEAALDTRAEAAARLVAEQEAAAQRCGEASRRAAQSGQALAQVEAELARAEAELLRAGAARAAAVEAFETARARAEAAEGRLSGAEAEAGAARAADAVAQAALAEAAGIARGLAAEMAGLERLLARPEGAQAQILDRLHVEPGLELALGAALADDLLHPALEGDAATGWHVLPPLVAAPLPAAAQALAGYVAAPPELGRRLAAIGLVERAEGAALQPGLAPGQRLVSREGDLWRWDGLRVAAGAAPSAAGQRLQQMNRLAALRQDAAAAEAEEARLRAAQVSAAARLAEAVRAEGVARSERRAAELALSESGRGQTRAEAAAEQAQGRAAALRAGRARRSEEAGAAAAARAEADRAAAALPDGEAARAAVAAERVRVEAARLIMLTRRAEAEELDRAGTARTRRLEEIARDVASWEARRATAAERLAALGARAEAAVAELTGLRLEPPRIEARLAALGAVLNEAEARRRRASDALAEAEAVLREAAGRHRGAEQAAGEAREARARAEALCEAAQSRAVAARERLLAEAGAEPEALLARFGADPEAIVSAAELEGEALRLRRARDALGPVNLRAEEDARDATAECAALAAERDDLDEAIRKLRQGIAALNREGRGRLVTAFEEVNRNFTALFRHLFGGGEASLMLVESDDPLEAGLEILCQPPGKKLSTLSLLSGGEQTLTALSLIFAVFLSNPSPICVLDEVDAPLDDANVTRFCDLLDEMTERTDTRFLIITHHAVTMSRMDRLYGVTMAERGVSQLVTVDLAAAERIVEPIG